MEIKYKACGMFTADQPIRAWSIHVILSKTFDTLVNFVIFLNCITLALNTPFAKCCDG